MSQVLRDMVTPSISSKFDPIVPSNSVIRLTQPPDASLNMVFSKQTKSSKISVATGSTRITQSSGTPSRSARFLYMSSLMGRVSAVLRPHPRNMVDSLKSLAEDVVCIRSVKEALVQHVNEIEKLIVSNRKAGAMMNKSMMYWRMLLKQQTVDENEVMNMIGSVTDKMDRIKYQLNIGEEPSLLNQYMTARLFQCYLDDGLRIILFDSNEDIKEYIDSARRMRKTLRKLQKKLNSSDYFDNIKEWLMDAVVKCYVIMAVDTVSALKLQPPIKDLVKNVKDGNSIETQFVNRLRTFNVKLYLTMLEAKQRRCQTMFPMDEILTKMQDLNNLVRNSPDPSENNPMEHLKFLEEVKEATAEEMVPLTKRIVLCDPVVLKNTYKKINPPELFPLFV